MDNLFIIILGLLLNTFIFIFLKHFYQISSLKIFFYINFLIIPILLTFILLKINSFEEILFYIFFYIFFINYCFIGIILIPQSSIRFKIIEKIINKNNKIKIREFKKNYNDKIIFKLRKKRLIKSNIINKKKPFFIKKKFSIFLLLIFYFFKKINNQDNYF